MYTMYRCTVPRFVVWTEPLDLICICRSTLRACACSSCLVTPYGENSTTRSKKAWKREALLRERGTIVYNGSWRGTCDHCTAPMLHYTDGIAAALIRPRWSQRGHLASDGRPRVGKGSRIWAAHDRRYETKHPQGRCETEPPRGGKQDARLPEREGGRILRRMSGFVRIPDYRRT